MLQKPLVLSTGGGAFISKDLRELIKMHGFSIWLKADFETLWPRVSGKNNRPLLNQMEPQKALKSLKKPPENLKVFRSLLDAINI